MPLLQLQLSSTAFFWIPGCLILGAAYAFLLYPRRPQPEKKLQNLLFGLRTVVVSAIALLLFAPLVKTMSKSFQKPLIIIAQDNSASIGISKPPGFNAEKYALQLKQLEKTLSDDYEVQAFNFDAQVKQGLNFTFDGKLSNLSSVFKLLDNQFANRNIGAVILATDGIYNTGANPLYESKSLKAPVYTIALGDTIPKRDILISNINYNNIVYLDNQFQLEVGVGAFQSRGAQSRLTVSDQSGTVFSQPVSINSNEFRQTIPVTLLARKKGIQRYNISLSPISNELSAQNNSQTIFVEVVDGRQNVLIIANAPHPDLAALKQSIELHKNYQVKTLLADQVTDVDIEKAGLIILHQLPSLSNPAPKVMQQIAAKPVLFILGVQSNTGAFSAVQPVLNINSSGSFQEVTAKIQPDFYGFTLSENSKNKLQTLAPLTAPFGNYGFKNPASVALNQQIGKVATAMPLLVFTDEPKRKIGVLAGEGIWRWWLEEFSETGGHEAVNELLHKTVQFLSSTDDKRKFRVYPAKNAFDENEHVILNAELYNEAYELVNTSEVNISLKNNQDGNYSFLFSRTGNAYILDAGILPSGEYTYQAQTTLGNKKQTATGQFVITERQTELQQTTANHQLLFAMAEQSGGDMVYPAQISALVKMIRDNENVKTIAYEDRQYQEPVDFKIVFFLILALLSAEWFLRKRNGDI
ncbi:MAG TPA: hypothetical protein VEV16_04155 [Daejeonella sp.]|nr:hypothetical protein [Daejeonella sp.]